MGRVIPAALSGSSVPAKRREAYFEKMGVDEAEFVRIRTALASRIQKTSAWKSLIARPGYGVEIHLDVALGAMFLTMHGFREPPRCYVMASSIAWVGPLIPLLTVLAREAPSLYVALMVMSIVSVSPAVPFLSFGTEAIHASMIKFPDDVKFWIDYGIGKKFCEWIETVVTSEGRAALVTAGVLAQVEAVVSGLIRLGVPEATETERMLQP